jgi:hypothetical protein
MKRPTPLTVVLAVAMGLSGCAAEAWRPQTCEEVAAAVEIRFVGIESLELKEFGGTRVKFGRFVVTNGSTRSVDFDIWSEPPIAGVYPDSIWPEVLVDGEWKWRGDLSHYYAPSKAIHIPSGDTWVFHAPVDGLADPQYTDVGKPHRLVLTDTRRCRMVTQSFVLPNDV